MENSILYYIKDISEIESVSLDLKFLSDKYEFIYFIDTYDILEYISPSPSSFKSLDKFKMYASHAVSYHRLFTRGKYKTIRLQEYEGELESIKLKFESLFSKNSIDDIIKELKAEYSKTKSKENSRIPRKNLIEKFYKNYFCSIISLATGILNESNLKRFKILIDEHMSKEHIQSRNDSKRLSWVNSRIEQTSYSTIRVNEVFRIFCNEVKFFLSSFTNKERKIYLSNTYRDIQVIDRLLILNKRLTRRSSNLFRCRFISSTPRKTMILKNICNSYYSKEFKTENFKSDIIRTNQQYFLTTVFNKLRDNGNNDIELLIKSCERAIKANETVKKKFESSSNLIFLEEELDLAMSKSRIDLSNILNYETERVNEKQPLLGSEKIVKNLSGALNDAKKGKFKELDEIIDETIKLLKTGDVKKSFENAKETFDNYSHLFDVKSKFLLHYPLQNFKNGEIPLRFTFGKDVIRSYAQSFPILLFFNPNKIRKFLPEFESLVISIITAQNYPKETNAIPKLFNKFLKVNMEGIDINDEKIYILFLQMFLDKQVFKKERNDDVEAYCLKQMESITPIMDYVFMEPEITHSSKGDKKLNFKFNQEKEIQNDVAYFKSYLYRRLNEFENSFEVLNKANSKDPRILLSKGLTQISKYYKQSSIGSKSVDELLKQINDAKSLLKSAKNGFANWIFKDHKIMDYVNDGILNSLADLDCQYAIKSNDFSAFDKRNKARENIEKIKLRLGNEVYDLHHSYCHTEVDIEFCEAMFLHINGLDASQKLRSAATRLQTINSYNKLKDLIILNDSLERLLFISKIIGIDLEL